MAALCRWQLQSLDSRAHLRLVLKTSGRIYALDIGKDHHNPECERVGEKHKHRWTERYKDKLAYVPHDITEPASDPTAVWEQFCAEAAFRHLRVLEPIPPTQGELF